MGATSEGPPVFIKEPVSGSWLAVAVAVAAGLAVAVEAGLAVFPPPPVLSCARAAGAKNNTTTALTVSSSHVFFTEHLLKCWHATNDTTILCTHFQ
jgi:hypothetical protein